MSPTIILPRVNITRPSLDSSIRILSSRVSPVALIASEWSELRLVRDLQLLDSASCYLLVGEDEQRLRVRVGEAVKPWPRIGDHMYDRSLAWVERLYVIVGTSRFENEKWNKADVVALQAELSDEVKRVGRAHLHAGVGPLRFPASPAARLEAKIILETVRSLLADAGCPVLTPRRRSLQCMLATSAELTLAH
jgi:hypothetical protein